MTLGAAACSADPKTTEPVEDPEEYLGLTAPTQGFQLRSVGTTIPPGEDVEFCEVAELPGEAGETYMVNSVELGNAPYSHHLIVLVATAGSAADAALRELDIGDQVPCLSAETAFGYDGIERVAGTQQRYNRIDYPEGVGREYHGGQRAVFDYHYYNTSSEPVQARGAVNFHVVDDRRVSHIAREFQFNNWTIDTPPGGQGSFVGECRFDQDVKVGELVRHTHQWGTDYSVWFAGGARDGEHVWTSTDWEEDVAFPFDEPVLVEAGEGFRFQCDYYNTESRALRFGPNATDEMCILFPLAWNAGAERDIANPDCDIVWTDADGIGREASDGGFPKPTASEVDLCLGGAAPEGVDECETCACDGCASPLFRCATDAECAPILACLQETPDACQDVADAHSSAVGLVLQIRSCLEHNQCSTCSGLRF